MLWRKLLAAGLIFGSGVVVNAGSHFLKTPNLADGFCLGLGALMLPLAWVLQPRSPVYSRFAAARMAAGRKKVLLLFLSAVREVPDWVMQLLTGELETDLLRLAELKRDCPERRWSWEQPLRGIHHLQEHAPLERLVLIGSTLSVSQMPEFHQILQRYPQFQGPQSIQVLAFLKNHMELKPVEQLSGAPAGLLNGFDFEDFDDMASALLAAIRQIKASGYGYTDKDIQIDYTGGQKPTSVVAASITFGNYITNQYVATNPSDADKVAFDVWGYDVTEELPRLEG